MSRLATLGLCLLAVLAAGCTGLRVIITTGTTIGLKATPGDGQTRSPQVTLGYKRAELALVPTAGTHASATEDAFSTLAAFYFNTKWFGRTELSSFIGTGAAARDIQQQPEFQKEIAEATARFETSRTENRAQLAAAGRITEAYRKADPAKRTRILGKATELGLVPKGTTDDAFAKGKLSDAAVGGSKPVTDKFTQLEAFTTSVIAE
jgi:hypothetical protein